MNGAPPDQNGTPPDLNGTPPGLYDARTELRVNQTGGKI
jgi:hypothetical protein